MTQRGPTTFDPLAAVQTPLNTPLSRLLAERISQAGPITFHDWMDACLYHPEHGYYRRGTPTVGRQGDFLTSPEVHPLFGAAIGHVAIDLWKQLGSPEPFRIAEVGPGTGALAEALLRHIRAHSPACADAISYTAVEPDPNAASLLRQRLHTSHNVHNVNNVHIVHNIRELASDNDLIVANELLDALPVHRLQFLLSRWRELLVSYSPAQGFSDSVAEVSDQALFAPLDSITPSEGQVVEVAPGRGDVTATLADATRPRGMLLLFDYGYLRERLYASWRRDGTLMTFRNHVPGDDPYAHPGEQDITAHIDIDQVTEAAQSRGLTPLPALSQAEWLHNLGAAVLPAVADARIDTNAYLSARRAAETLTEPAGLGRIAVMGFTRGEFAGLPGWTTS